MKKKSAQVIFIILLILIVVFSKRFFYSYRNTDTIINKIGCRLYELNKINVEIEGDIKLVDIYIKNSSKTVYKNGRQKKKIKVDYGYCVLEIYHKKDLISEIGHFKTNNWYTNDYFLKIHKENEEIDIQYRIEGPKNGFNSFKKEYERDKNNEIVKINYFNEKDSLYNTELVDDF